MPPNQNQQGSPNVSVNESVRQLMASVPKPVQIFLKGPGRTQALRGIAQKYALSGVQVSVFERDSLLLLLGALLPEELVADLRDAGVSNGAIEGVTNELTALVLPPTQTASAAQVSRQPVAPVPSYKPPPPRPLQSPIPGAPPIQRAEPPANLPGVMPGRLLPDHEVPHINVPPQAVSPAPRPTPQMPPTPRPPFTGISQPQMGRPGFSPPAPPPPPPQAQKMPPSPPKDYGADPYREPIDL